MRIMMLLSLSCLLGLLILSSIAIAENLKDDPLVDGGIDLNPKLLKGFLINKKYDVDYVAIYKIEYRTTSLISYPNGTKIQPKNYTLNVIDSLIPVNTTYKKEFYKSQNRIEYANDEFLTVSVWNFPIGDRNVDEFGKCRAYEREKGQCEEY